MPQTIENIDEFFISLFNGGNSMFIDQLAIILTNGFTWVPLYIGLIILVIKNNEKISQVGLVIGMVAFALLLSDGMADFIVKPLVARPRPIADPSLNGIVTVVNGYKPSGYSFFSAHAANTFAVALFLALLVKNSVFSLFMVAWAMINCWTRLYLRVHFMSDIVVGIAWGSVSAIIAYLIYYKLFFKISPRLHYISSQYTRSGYSLSDIDMVLNIMVLTILVSVILSCLWA